LQYFEYDKVVFIEGSLISVTYDRSMRILRMRDCFIAASIGLMATTLVSPANSQSGFHASSRNLPATLETENSNCYELATEAKAPGAEYIPGLNSAGGQIVPADVPSQQQDFYPVVRFDLGIGKRRVKPAGRKKELRARNLTVAEVSIDTSTGVVALDGQKLTPPKRYSGCDSRAR
jgi:hypothetical protein